jgi:V/A-type H+-transporting ATPase subunit I
MIVRMAKVEIIGPKDLLLPTLEVVREEGVLQVEPALPAMAADVDRLHLHSTLLDRQNLAERLYFGEIKRRIETLLALLPPVAGRETYLSPARAVTSLNRLVDAHIDECQSRARALGNLHKEQEELLYFGAVLSAIEPLVREVRPGLNLDFIGIELREAGMLEGLTRAIHRLTEGRYEIQTTKGPQGTLIVLIATERQLAATLRKGLQKERLPELAGPSGMENLPLPEKIRAVSRRADEVRTGIGRLEEEQGRFAARWGATYRKVDAWLEDRLSLLQKTAAVLETEMCFILLGWLPAADLGRVRAALAMRFAGQVVIEEKEILEQDLERIPVAMHNPAYFRPFELLSRLLPLPRYGNFDPTPFLGIFFPIFFGMILGDIGYGLLLLAAALAMVFLVTGHPDVVDAGKILGVCALYTIVFGWLFGECFGTFGAELLGLEPVCFDRMTAIIPMLWFSLAIGAAHLMLGLGLGAVAAFRRQLRKEALYKLVSLLAVLGLIAYLATYLLPRLGPLRGPLRAAVLVLLPLLLACGGLLAPLELLKTFGNIISYARIMAVGLTSVLLAYVANRLAGTMGSVLVGVLVAVLLHAFNIVLGVFAPTVHALRLHYVEFFGKFLEPGGRRFEPMERK